MPVLMKRLHFSPTSGKLDLEYAERIAEGAYGVADAMLKARESQR
jgi:hypothetical protein